MCWQIWKEGRGSSEACRHGGTLLAIEYISPHQGGGSGSRRAQIELESASFDGFCVVWTLNPSVEASDCSIPIRFHCLSTDFSHSKGVKGLPLRLCAKTEMITPLPDNPSFINSSELCFCLVKLFRDHGAERKLSHDVAHVNKVIEKLKQRIVRAELRVCSSGQPKKSELVTKSSGTGLNKIAKPKKSWSMGLDKKPSGGTKEGLETEIAAMQHMLYSTRPVSILYLRGVHQDDPDVFPVHLNQKPDLKVATRHDVGDFKFSPATNTGSSYTASLNLASASTTISNSSKSSSPQLGGSSSSPNGSDGHSHQLSLRVAQSQRGTVSASTHRITRAEGISLLGSVDTTHLKSCEQTVQPSKSDISFPNNFWLTRLQLPASTCDPKTMRQNFTAPYISYNEQFKTWLKPSLRSSTSTRFGSLVSCAPIAGACKSSSMRHLSVSCRRGRTLSSISASWAPTNH